MVFVVLQKARISLGGLIIEARCQDADIYIGRQLPLNNIYQNMMLNVD